MTRESVQDESVTDNTMFISGNVSRGRRSGVTPRESGNAYRLPQAAFFIIVKEGD